MEKRKPISSILAGVIIAVLLIIVSSLIGGGDSSPSGGWISWLIIIGGLIFFINRYANAKDNYVTFGELFSYGFKATSMMALIFVVFVLILAFAYPEMKDKAIEMTRLELEKQKNTTESDIDKTISVMNQYFWVGFAGIMLLVVLVIGCIGSLVGAAVTQKRPLHQRDQLNQLDQLDS